MATLKQAALAAGHRVANLTADFCINHNLTVNAGLPQLPIGLFSEQINYTKMEKLSDMYKIILDEMEKQSADAQQKQKEQMDDHLDNQNNNEKQQDDSSGESPQGQEGDQGQQGQQSQDGQSQDSQQGDQGQQSQQGDQGQGDNKEDSRQGDQGQQSQDGQDGSTQSTQSTQSNNSQSQQGNQQDSKDSQEGSGNSGEDMDTSDLDKKNKETLDKQTSASEKSQEDPEKLKEEQRQAQEDLNNTKSKEIQDKLKEIQDRNKSNSDVQFDEEYNAKFSWQKILKKMMPTDDKTKEETYTKISRRNSSGLKQLKDRGIMAGKPGQISVDSNKKDVLFVIDNSGSVGAVLKKVNSEINKLVEKNSKDIGNFYIIKFDTNFIAYKVDLKSKTAQQITNSKDLLKLGKIKKLNLKDTKIPMKKMFSSDGMGGGTEFGPELTKICSLVLKGDGNIILFSDTDLLWDSNARNINTLMTKYGKQPFKFNIIMDSKYSFNKFVQTIKAYKYLSHFDI